MILYSFANSFSSFAQESIFPDSLLRQQDKIVMPIMSDSAKLQENRKLDILLQQLDMLEMKSQLQAVNNQAKSIPEDSAKDLEQLLPPEFKPFLAFNLDASRWKVPIIGDVTTFSPGLIYQATEDLSFFGGVNFSQYHNLAYMQNMLMPGLPAKSNITADAFVGASYTLRDRIIFHASYQRSLYNQLPYNMIVFAPGQNVVIAGASFDLYHGLGVTVDHVWEFDMFGHKRQGFRYSPYIDVKKFIKFLHDQ